MGVLYVWHVGVGPLSNTRCFRPRGVCIGASFSVPSATGGFPFGGAPSRSTAPCMASGRWGGRGWESVRMGGSDNKGDGLASQPRCYRAPGQPLLNRHQVGGVSRSPEGLFVQQEREPTRGRPAMRGKGTYGGRPGQRVEEQGRRIRREETPEAAPEAVRQAVGGGCQSGWGRLLSVTNTIETGTWRQGDRGWG